MVKFQEINTSDIRYPFVEELLHTSFPLSERRDDTEQRYNTDSKDHFHCYLILDDDTHIGMISVWEFPEFSYVEHLATSPKIRNKGYGKQIMEALRNQLDGIIILEVERPEDEMSIRRINFYKRCGFSLCEMDYIQPPYRKGGESLPLYLMYSGAENIDDRFECIKRKIYSEIYGVE
ncbi:GNAT family N-acetyltransferase [uncultured Bacteroides sp.]|uniref:GNAT family N-acetyltransferase n=1 Tax=uncultured Bacteroides sp. TaxID=162156 RepID=UPI00262A6C5F|nr:GNAT family N-acetyltransferase [uncultured Bacteroides sp.]